ncbi:hypothetical protein K491DRAFT_675870 [Lophiostoma macrostomum CBS 122681]|uniref:Uncharacterized protein n=1 Tax=Lophiostoma macrostomum CBS 122681 TaxID=1314788 RepID=A0A6A6TJN9_9PLEO|nr:hypothetical protein K491DRAFT_675870 [Lophiostoma macrostomum CBS 122681]
MVMPSTCLCRVSSRRSKDSFRLAYISSYGLRSLRVDIRHDIRVVRVGSIVYFSPLAKAVRSHACSTIAPHRDFPAIYAFLPDLTHPSTEVLHEASKPSTARHDHRETSDRKRHGNQDTQATADDYGSARSVLSMCVSELQSHWSRLDPNFGYTVRPWADARFNQTLDHRSVCGGSFSPCRRASEQRGSRPAASLSVAFAGGQAGERRPHVSDAGELPVQTMLNGHAVGAHERVTKSRTAYQSPRHSGLVVIALSANKTIVRPRKAKGEPNHFMTPIVFCYICSMWAAFEPSCPPGITPFGSLVARGHGNGQFRETLVVQPGAMLMMMLKTVTLSRVAWPVVVGEGLRLSEMTFKALDQWGIELA